VLGHGRSFDRVAAAPVVYGRSDDGVMPEVAAFVAARIPRFELVTVPDAGHPAHRRAPEAFADLVRQGLIR
jgi:pimeloyl-ACP methyl ester carboxylesterase